jgi:CDP-diglyceride synthetase
LRVLVAIPLAVLVIVFVEAGGIAFALFVIVVGWLCMYELYRMLDRWKPLPIVGFAALAGMVLAGVYGGQRQVAEVAMATLPVLFLLTAASASRRSRSRGRCSGSTGSGSRSLTPGCCASSRTATR